MFGIFYGFVRLIGRTIFQINTESLRFNAKQEAIRENRDFYFDGNGAMWYCGNGNDEKCLEWFGHNVYTGKHDSKNGHHVLVSAKDFRVLKDYTVEQNTKEENEFYDKFNKAMNESREKGKAYFHVSGIYTLDKRYGFYEMDGCKQYTLNKIQYKSDISRGLMYAKTAYVYYKNYYNGRTKTDEGKREHIEISKEEYEKLGGDYVLGCCNLHNYK